MVELGVSYWIFTALGVLVTIVQVVTSIYILYKYTIDLKIWKKIEYQLILIRVFCDIFNGIGGCGYFTSSSFTLLYSNIVPFDVTFLFGLFGSNFLGMRSFLAAIIAIERVVATMVPLKFYYYRRRISNAPVIAFIISTAVAVEVVLFGFCGFRLPLPVGCTNYACATPPCYLTYAAVTKMIYGSVNAAFSILLCAKIFLLSWRQASVQADLRRVNWISLTDGLSTLSFDVLPTMIFDSRIIDISVWFVYLSISVVDLFYDLVSYNVSFMFGIISFNLMEVRCYIAAIIAIERVLATTIPLKFYRHRSKISNSFIVCCVISLGITADVTLFGFCGYRFEPVPGCTNFNCATPACFQRYTSVTRMLYTITNFSFSIILCYKLFWMSLKNTKMAVDIKKANLICLTDGFSALIFELIPWCISYYGIIDIKLGPIIGSLRTTGRVLESYVMLKLMKKEVV
ncbi:Protein CBR-SRBC-45, partial [Caenorhabditis briggsae]